MNKPINRPIPDPDIGPLNEHGQQIWTTEEAAAIARLVVDPAYRASVREALAEADAGQARSQEDVFASLAEMKKCWRAERGR